MIQSNLIFIFSEPVVTDLCNPSPCGPNANCNDGICTCLTEYNGDPYFECRPECTISSECPRNKACVRNHCVDPCVNTCGINANCEVVNHMAICTCPMRTTGNAFIQCSPIKGELLVFVLSLSEMKRVFNGLIYI